MRKISRNPYKNTPQNTQLFVKKNNRIWFPKFIESALSSKELSYKQVTDGAVE